MESLLWSEYSHANRAVKTMQEILYKEKCIPYSVALEGALRIYDKERKIRFLGGDSLARQLDLLGDAARKKEIDLAPFLDPVSAKLFQVNHGIQSSLILRDPLGSKAETFLREHIQSKVRAKERVTFKSLVKAFNEDFAEPHRLLQAKLQCKPAHELPLGLQPIAIRFSATCSIRFATRAAWASFIAKYDAWRDLPDRPSIPFEIMQAPQASSASSRRWSGSARRFPRKVSELFSLANEIS